MIGYISIDVEIAFDKNWKAFIERKETVQTLEI